MTYFLFFCKFSSKNDGDSVHLLFLINFSTVYKGTLVKERISVAVKHIDSTGNGKDQEALLEMMDEARVMQLYNHKNIVKFYGFIVDRAPYLLVMEYCKVSLCVYFFYFF